VPATSPAGCDANSPRVSLVAVPAVITANIITDITDNLDDWSMNWWFLGVVFAIAFLDSVVPIVPSETTVIIAGVAVATGDAKYALWAVIVAGAVGAFLGDNAAYAIGHHWGGWFHRRAEHKPNSALDCRATDKRRWLITARFISAVARRSPLPAHHPPATLVVVRWGRLLQWGQPCGRAGVRGGQAFKDDHTVSGSPHCWASIR
jgi:membrane protein YqaA with SNARE-associated domain